MQGILLSLRGYSKSSLGNDTGALADYELALGKDPLHTASLVRRGVSFMKLGRYEEACESFKRGMILEPDNKTIASFIEELDTKIYEMKESEARVKYPLKKKISEIMYNVEEEDEDIFLNFSNLKDIDK
jgi:tetratricopeptide (TPR) repeat protein